MKNLLPVEKRWLNGSLNSAVVYREALQALRRRLPSGWKADLESEPNASAVHAYFRVAAANRKVGRLAVEVERRLEPRGVLEMAARWQALSRKEPGLIIAPYLSSAIRERLRTGVRSARAS